MKKLLITIIILFTLSIFAYAGTTSFAYINTSYILQNYKGASSIHKDLLTKKAKLDKILSAERDTLLSQKKALTANGKKPSKAILNAFTQKEKNFKITFTKMQSQLDKYQAQQMQNLKSIIKNAVIEVAKKDGYKQVLENQVVWYGGVSITNQVLKVLNNMKSVNIN